MSHGFWTTTLRPALIAPTLMIVLAVFGSQVSAQAVAQDKAAPPPPTVTVALAVAAEVVGRVPVSGTLVARSEVLVLPEVSGQSVQTILADVGDTVTKGDILATLSRTRLESQMAQAEAEYARAEAVVRQAESNIKSAEASRTQAEAALERSERLKDTGNVSQASADQAIAAAQTARAAFASATDGLGVAKAQLQQAAAQRDIARLDLDHAELIAPVDGIISERNLNVGAIASSAGSPAFRIIENNQIEVEAEIIETALAEIQKGADVELNVAGVGALTGKVRLISPTVDPQNRLGMIRIEVTADPRLKTGLFADGWIITARRTSLTVPVTAVLTDRDGAFALAVTDGIITRRRVQPGLIWLDRREIVSGLDAGETVVAKAGAFFHDGDRVIAITADNAVAEASK